MTGSALLDFLIAVVGLCIMIYLIFRAIDFLSPDDRFRMFGRYAVGGAALLMFLVAIKSVLFSGGAGGISVTPVGIIEFAIGLIVVMVVIFVIYFVIDRLAPPDLAVPVKYVIGALALIAILVLAERVLTGGGSLGLVGGKTFQLSK